MERKKAQKPNVIMPPVINVGNVLFDQEMNQHRHDDKRSWVMNLSVFQYVKSNPSSQGDWRKAAWSLLPLHSSDIPLPMVNYGAAERGGTLKSPF